MFLIDIPIVAYKTLGITILRKTEDGYVEDYDATEEFENNSNVSKLYPYSSSHQHV